MARWSGRSSSPTGRSDAGKVKVVVRGATKKRTGQGRRQGGARCTRGRSTRGWRASWSEPRCIARRHGCFLMAGDRPRGGAAMPVFDTYAQGTPNWVELMTPDQRAAAEFYGALFGWQMVENPLDDGHVYIVGSLQGDAVAGITFQLPELAGPSGVLERLPRRRRRRRRRRPGRAGGRHRRGRAVRLLRLRPYGAHPGPDRRPGQPLAAAHHAARSARTSPAPRSGTSC